MLFSDKTEFQLHSPPKSTSRSIWLRLHNVRMLSSSHSSSQGCVVRNNPILGEQGEAPERSERSQGLVLIGWGGGRPAEWAFQ